MSCIIIAEAGVNHNGDLEKAKELVYAAKEAGADIVKFQTFKADSLVTKDASLADYQKDNTHGNSTQYEMLKKLELSEDAHFQLVELANNLKIEFMSTGFDNEAIDFLIALGVKRIKIPSGEITNLPYLAHAAKSNLPLLISTGMSDISEVKMALDIVSKESNTHFKDRVTLLHCTSNYPTELKNVNLLAMQTLANEFNLPVGYSDHTIGNFVPTLAVAMGACVIEKHFTLDKGLDGPDHILSMTPDEMKIMIKEIRNAEIALGTGVKQPTQSEMPVRDLVRRSVTLRHGLVKGTVLSEGDLILLRPGHGIKPVDINQVIGAVLKVDLPPLSTLQWEHLIL